MVAVNSRYGTGANLVAVGIGRQAKASGRRWPRHAGCGAWVKGKVGMRCGGQRRWCVWRRQRWVGRRQV